MHGLSALYNFLNLAQNNRKYPVNTANNLKSALKIFEQVLTKEELNSLDLIEQRIEEIFLSVLNANKGKSIESLNTYKARLLKVIKDYKKYGQNPAKIQIWQPKLHKSTPLLNRSDKQDKTLSILSALNHTPVESVHKIELSLSSGSRAILSIPRNIKKIEAQILKSIIDSLSN